MEFFKSHKDLTVYQLSYKLAIEIFELSRAFPKEEVYSLTDQIRRSSRSVSANIAEAFRKRRYKKAFIAKLSDVESEAAETQVWLDFSKESGYLNEEKYTELYESYNNVLGKIINADKWTF